jgi:hypothetical protein
VTVDDKKVDAGDMPLSLAIASMEGSGSRDSNNVTAIGLGNTSRPMSITIADIFL